MWGQNPDAVHVRIIVFLPDSSCAQSDDCSQLVRSGQLSEHFNAGMVSPFVQDKKQFRSLLGKAPCFVSVRCQRFFDEEWDPARKQLFDVLRV